MKTNILSEIFKGRKKDKQEVPAPKFDKLPKGWPEPENGSWSYYPKEDESKGISFNKVAAEDHGKVIAERLKQGDIKSFSLHLSQWEKENKTVMSDFAAGLPQTNVTNLYVTNGGSHENMIKLFEALPDSKVESLDLTYVRDKETYEKLAEILPRTKIKKLSISADFITDETIKPVLENLPPRIEHLDLSSCRDLSDDSVETLLPSIGKTNLKYISLMSTGVTDKHMPDLIEKLKNPNTIPTAVDLTWSKASEESNDEIAYVYAKKNYANRNTRYTSRIDRKFAIDPLMGLSDMRKPENLQQYALAGRLDEVMEKGIKHGRPITTDELLAPVGEYKSTALGAARMRYDLDKVFDSKCWVDTKDMQKAYDTLSKKDKIQLDGKNGRPSFETNKKEVPNTPATAKFKAMIAQRAAASRS